MEFTTLGRTGLETSVAGLGCGGPSRLGLSVGAEDEQAVAVVRAALDEGITLLDTSELYGTEEVVGRAIAGRRDEVVLATKGFWRRRADRFAEPADIERAFEQSLSRLGTDHLDVYFLHAVDPDVYQRVAETLVPVLDRLRTEGKVRAIGVTEHFEADPGHRMLELALGDGWCDVVMVGYNVLNQSAGERVFALTRQRRAGVLVMFAVRRALSRPERLRDLIADLVTQGFVDADLDPDDPLGFLVHEGGAESIVDAAYRFCRHDPGVDVVLTGTGNVEHLKANVASLLRPPLPSEDVERLRSIFGRVDTVTGN